MSKPSARQWFIAQYGLHKDGDDSVDGMRDIVSNTYGSYLGEADLIIEILFRAVKHDMNYIYSPGFAYMCSLLNIDYKIWQTFFKRLYRAI